MASGNLLCVVNYPANIGYAWNFVEGIYATLSDRLAPIGVRTFVAYPEIGSAPVPLKGSKAEAVVLDGRMTTASSVGSVVAFVRKHGVDTLYLPDSPVWGPQYALLKAAGVRKIVVHIHTMGLVDPVAPTGVKRLVKSAIVKLPGMVADRIIGVSTYVSRKQVEVGLIEERRVRTVSNGIDPGDILSVGVPEPSIPVAVGRPYIAAACRAQPYKGIQHLLRAYDLAMSELAPGLRPALVYAGDGPHMPVLREIASGLAFKDDIIFTGYRHDARAITKGGLISVQPSVWPEAFGLAVLEAMAFGRPVIGSAVGGIPDMIDHERTGFLVPPGDERALADALIRLVTDDSLRQRLGAAAKERALTEFTYDKLIEDLLPIVTPDQAA